MNAEEVLKWTEENVGVINTEIIYGKKFVSIGYESGPTKYDDNGDVIYTTSYGSSLIEAVENAIAGNTAIPQEMLDYYTNP